MEIFQQILQKIKENQEKVNLALIFVLFLILCIQMKQCSDTSNVRKNSDKKVLNLQYQIDSIRLEETLRNIALLSQIDSIVDGKIYGPLKLKYDLVKTQKNLSNAKSNINTLSRELKQLKSK